MHPPSLCCDLAIVGAGAAGLATGIFAARRRPGLRVVAFDGAARLGAKILVSGGGRCNVTNVRVTPEDYCGGSRHIIRRVLNALPIDRTIEFFRGIGVELYEDYAGKLFPTTGRARTVLDALLRECARLGVELRRGCRVTSIDPDSDGGFVLMTRDGPVRTGRVVLATGGLSLPRTGSDGAGYEFARRLGHGLTPTTPALAPLTLAGDFHRELSGMTHDVELSLFAESARPVRIRGSLLWTHFGVSGPAALDMSRHWHRAALDSRPVRLAASFLPGDAFEQAEARLLSAASRQPKARIETVLAAWIPARLASAVVAAGRLPGGVVMSHLSREQRRTLVRLLTQWPLPVTGSRGFGHAEVTAGGVPLDEIDAATMASRCCRGLHLVGEMLDCDGRIGGFNFQWAWATACAAASGL